MIDCEFLVDTLFAKQCLSIVSSLGSLAYALSGYSRCWRHMQLTHSPQGWPPDKPAPRLVSWWSTIMQWVTRKKRKISTHCYSSIFHLVLVFIFDNATRFSFGDVRGHFSFLVLDHFGRSLVRHVILDSSFRKSIALPDNEIIIKKSSVACSENNFLHQRSNEI